MLTYNRNFLCALLFDNFTNQDSSHMAIQLKRRLLSLEEFQRMIEVGIFTEHERIELIKGEMITINAVSSRHAGCVNFLTRRLSALIPPGTSLTVQKPITCPHYSMPEPDIAIVKARKDDYRNHHPKPEDIYLVIEVADSLLDYDRDIKGSIYAGAGIPEYWLINLPAQQIEVYRQAKDDMYRLRELFRRGERLLFDELGIGLSVSEILGED